MGSSLSVGWGRTISIQPSAAATFLIDTGWTHLIYDRMDEPGGDMITKEGRAAFESVIAAVIFSLMPATVITLDMALGAL